MQCPKCSYARTDRDAVVPDWQCPKCGIVYTKFKGHSEASLSITMASGQTLAVTEIKLFDSVDVSRLLELSRLIEKNFRGFSTGLGFVGSAEWVVGGLLATAVIDGLGSSVMAETATKQIEEARELYKNIRRTAVYAKVESIANIEIPETENWKVPQFKSPLRKELIQMQSKFITVKCDGNEHNLFWDKVEQYAYVS